MSFSFRRHYCFVQVNTHIHVLGLMNKISIVEMSMLCWMCGNNRSDKIRNEMTKLERESWLAPIVEKMVENGLRSVEDKLEKLGAKN